MSLDVMAVVLAGALLHAVWNVLVRSAADKFFNTALIVGGAAAWTACWLPFAPAPAAGSCPIRFISIFIITAGAIAIKIS